MLQTLQGSIKMEKQHAKKLIVDLRRHGTEVLKPTFTGTQAQLLLISKTMRRAALELECFLTTFGENE